MSRSWDVFCRVIDNFGDAAVCWRLARQLAGEHGAQVRLWIDAADALHRLCPEVASGTPQQVVAGVDIRHWTPHADFGQPAEICVEAFGCGLPEALQEAMAQREPRTLWIVLEYLSAEPWVASHHGLPSPHPRLPLERFFFFPGVAPGTGGVLKEASLEARREAFLQQEVRNAGFWEQLGFAAPGEGAVVVSLFGYANAATGALLGAWAGGEQRIVAAVPHSLLRPGVGAFFGAGDPPDGAILQRGNLEVRLLPFLPQPHYDELLWACDWNFVRGEDSFVRAQWAGRTLVWQIYAQQDRAHWLKLEAFLDVYCAGLDGQAAEALRELWRLWNEPLAPTADQVGAAWSAACRHAAPLRRQARSWTAKLAARGDLAANLAKFCEDRLK